MWNPRLLSENYLFRKAGAASYSRGLRYADTGRVQIVSIASGAAHFLVQGTRPNPYKVFLEVFGDDLLYDCTCPVGQGGAFCKHCVAAAITLRRTLQKQGGEGGFGVSWKRYIDQLLDLPGLAPFRSKGDFYLLAFGLSRHHYYDPDFRLVPYWLPARQLERLLLPDAWPQTPKAWGEWLQTHHDEAAPFFNGRLPSSRYGARALNAPPGAVALAYALARGDTFVPLGEALEALVGWNIPIYRSSPRAGRPLEIVRQGARAVLALETVEGGLQLGAQMRVKGKVLEAREVWKVASRPPWLLVDGEWLVRPELKGLTEWLRALQTPLFIPQQEVETFRQRYLSRLLEKIGALEGGVVHYESIHAEPRPRLYLREVNETLGAELRFAYGEHEVPYQPSPPEVTSVGDPQDPWKFYHVHRDPKAEARWHYEAVRAKYGLKRGARQDPALLLLRARTSPVDFLLDKLPALAMAGFEIYGEEAIEKVRVNRHQPTLSINVTSGIDWFDVQTIVRFGEEAISLAEIRRALRKKRRYVKLADGSIGRLPEKWLERYQRLLGLASEINEEASTLRFADFHAVMVEELAEEADHAQADAGFRQRLERLRHFEGIAGRPLPEGLRGELRPYQIAGYNWLHFLHEYGFGGILADDMGLGKTVQVLAFLLSLREESHSPSPDLIVVPRSLLVNWQREVGKFTPALKVLPYFGPSRREVEKTFSDYDLVLTTYGVMRVDVEKLRAFRFHYIVLDESQAIKNPLAKTARAARRLQSEHRLAMTGTPVENSTFELWAQFAFVMPGLLGRLSYFKEQFVKPIEKERDEGTAQTLKRVVYPFILRRTKEQVAPELPPRTERVIYCPMEPAQRRFYLKLRDYYRGMLLGLIEEKGLDRNRMKILEALLRLRQASIHPKLIDPDFRGDSGKMEVLLETLETLHSEGHKALVFSQFVQMLQLVRKALDARGITYAYLDGRTRQRQQQVDRFQNDPEVSFFLISLKAGGVGLNLTAADYVVHVDPWWNPAVERQASDRTHRIGQDKPVFVFKLITRDSVEEKILQLQEKKKELVEKLIAAESSFFKELSPEDVQALFS